MIRVNHWMEGRPWLDLDNADIQGYVARVADEAGFDLMAALERWRTDGVVIFEGVVDTQLIDALLADVEYLRRHHRDFDLGVEVRGKQCRIQDIGREELDSPGIKFNSIHAISLAASKLSLTREVSVFLGHVFRGPPCALQSLTFYMGSQQPTHVDFPYVRCQSPLAHLAASWIPLEDIHADAGPLAYFAGSHRTEVSGFFDFGGGSIVLEPDSTRDPQELSDYLDERMRQAGIQPRVFLPKKGDVLVWHGNLSHAGTVIRDASRSRKSYVTHYTSLEAYPPGHRQTGAPELGARFQAHGGYVFSYPWLVDPKQLPSAT